MSLVRSEVVLSKAGDLPRDFITNTVYHTFSAGFLLGGPDWQSHADNVRDCYTGAAAGHSSANTGAACNIDVKVYNMSDAKPRPLQAISHHVGAGGADPSGEGPPQVCLCMSYFAGRNLKHERGRIFVGPMGTAQTNQRRPDNSTLAAVLELGHALWDVGGADVTWVLYRPTTNDTADITDIWVDNSWDIQRRRQLKSTNRVTVHP